MRNRFASSTALVSNVFSTRHAALLMLALVGLAAPMSANGNALPACTATISGNRTGCDLLPADPTTTITSAGVVTGTVAATNVSVNALINTGAINGVSEGVLNSNSSITTITNSGTISATAANGIAIDNTNSSTITTLTNSGAISATGTDGVAIFNDSTIDTITNQASGTIIGAVAAIGNNSNIGTITNAGTISATNGNGINNVSAITTLTNSGTISGSNAGIINNDPGIITTLTNSGTISGGIGIDLERSNIITLTNSGTIRGTSSHAIDHNSTGTITTLDNSGTIIASGTSGFGVFGIGTITTINNAVGGVISGPQGSILLDNPSANTTIIINNAGTLTGNVSLGEMGNLNITGNDTAVINGASVIADAVSYTPGGTGGNVTVTNGSRYNNNTTANFDVNNFTIENNARLRTNGARYDVANGFTNNGTLNLVNNSATSIGGNYTQASGATLSISASSDASFGSLQVFGDATFAAGTTLAVDVIGTTGSFTNGLTNVVSTMGVLNSSTFNVTDNSRLWDFESVADSNSISFNAVQVSAIAESNEAAVGNVNRGAANALNILTDNSANQAITNAFATLTTDAEVADAVNATVPNINNAINNTTFATLDVIQSTIADRQAGDGKSAGSGFIIADQHVWARPFGNFNDQDSKDGITGSDGSTYGITIGADGKTASGTTLGLAGTYANANQETDDGLQDADTDSYHLSAYGSHPIAAATDLAFEIGGGYNDNRTDRTINFGGLNSTAEGDYASYSGNIGAGIRHSIPLAARTFIRPEARIDYTLLYSESYNESGAGALNLNVEDQYFDELVPLVGAKLDHGISDRWSVSANGGVGYDVLNDANSIASSFVGGGGGFAVQGIENSPWVFRSGIDATYRADDTTSFNLSYSREDEGSDAQFQTIFLTARYAF